MRIIFMGTPEFAVPSLKKIHEKGFDVSLVICQPDRKSGRGKKLKFSPIKEYAIKENLEIYQPENINTDESINIIKDKDPDLIIVIAYGMILGKEILSIPRATINVHASILPKYRGAAPINYAIINGDERTGISIMEVEEGLDSGDVLAVKQIDIGDMNSLDLAERLSELGSDLLVKVLDDFDNYYYNKVVQDHEKATYVGKLYKDTGNIDWNKSAQDINNLVRGLIPWPNAFSYYKGNQFKIHKAKVVEKEVEGQPGQIVEISKDGIFIKTGNGILQVEELQVPGKRKMKVSEFLAGNKLEKEILKEV